MKMNNLTKGVVAFSVLSMLASGALIANANAATSTDPSTTGPKVNMGQNWKSNHGNKFKKPPVLTDAQKADMAAKKAAMDAKRTAVEAAINSGDYNTWVLAEKAISAKSPLLTKITADNFGKYAEAMKLEIQAGQILKDLGIGGQDHDGFGGNGR